MEAALSPAVPRPKANAPVRDQSEAALERAMYERALVDDWREINSHLLFWRACPNRACRRHRRCSGDPKGCHQLFWPVVPEPLKAWLSALGGAKKAGRSRRQSIDAGSKALAAARRLAKPLRL